MPPVYCTEAECQPEPIELELVERRPAAKRSSKETIQSEL
jgi:hypothetical protein